MCAVVIKGCCLLLKLKIKIICLDSEMLNLMCLFFSYQGTGEEEGGCNNNIVIIKSAIRLTSNRILRRAFGLIALVLRVKFPSLRS